MGAAQLGLPTALAGVAAGILAADATGAGLPAGAIIAVGLGLTAFTGAAPARLPWLALVGVAVVASGVGAWRGEESARPVEGTASVADLADGREQAILGTVVDDPRPRGDRLQLVLEEVWTSRGGAPVRLSDRLLVWLPRGIEAASGDRLRIDTGVELPEDFDGFAYRAYLERQGIGGIARARDAEVLPGVGGLGHALTAVRNALLGGLNRLVPEPEAALGAGILLGVRASIAPEINDAFAIAGLTHVVAISGWNIAIVAALVAAFVSPMSTRPGGRWTTATIAAVTVGGYVMLTGASPSVVRAALMAGAMLVGRMGGTRAHAGSALAMAALLMLLAAPPVLWDVGFQLSLLATAGLIGFGASVEGRLPRWWPPWIREPVALTLAAQLTTLPVVLVNFERLSLIAPIANVLVVPFVPAAMLVSAVASVVGVVDAAVHVPFAGEVATWLAGGPTWLVLWMIVSLGTAVAAVPGAAIDVHVPPPFAAAWFPVLALGAWAMRDPDAPPDSEARSEAKPGRVGRALRRVARPLPAAGAVVAVLLVITLFASPRRAASRDGARCRPG